MPPAVARSTTVLAVAALAVAALALPAHAQVRVPRGPAATAAPTTTVTVALAAGGRRLDATGQGRCQHAPRAAIYDVPAAMWMVQLTPADGGSLALTVWRPVGGGGATQFSFALARGGATHRIATVKGGTLEGAGTATLRPAGDGGEFTIDGTTASGATVRGTIRCARFSPLNEGVGG